VLGIALAIRIIRPEAPRSALRLRLVLMPAAGEQCRELADVRHLTRRSAARSIFSSFGAGAVAVHLDLLCVGLRWLFLLSCCVGRVGLLLWC
jgi:hypothetical protein